VAAVATAVVLKLRRPGGIMLPRATLSAMRAVLANRALPATIGLKLLAAIGTFVSFSYGASAWPVLLGADAAVVAPALGALRDRQSCRERRQCLGSGPISVPPGPQHWH